MASAPIERYRKSAKGKATNSAYSRAYYHRKLKHNPVFKAKTNQRNINNHYKRSYGLTAEEAMSLKKQGCALCGTMEGKLNIDHDHKTGKIRGVLCNPCNLMLGYYEQAEERRAVILEYLKRGY